MTYQQSHEEWEEKIIAKFAGDLDPTELVALDNHLRSCPQCVQMMKEYELLSNSIRLIEDNEPERQLPPAVVELKKEIVAQRRILEEAYSIVEATFNVPAPPEEVVTGMSEGGDQQLVLAYCNNRNMPEPPLSAPSFDSPPSGSGIFIYAQCHDRFFEVLQEEIESTEVIVEDAISRVLLDLFGEGAVDDVAIRFTSSPPMGLQHCSIHIRAQCSYKSFVLLPRTKENMEHAVKKSLCSLLRELFGSVEVSVEVVKVGIDTDFPCGQAYETHPYRGDQKD